MISTGIGHVTGVKDATKAGKTAARDAISEVDESPELAFTFASSYFDQSALISSITEELPCPVVGSSTAGEIVNGESHTESVVVMVIGGALECGVGFGPMDDEGTGGYEAITQALSGLGDGEITASVVAKNGDDWEPYNTLQTIVLGTANIPQKTPHLRSISDVTGNVPYVGGWAGDDWKYDETWIYEDGRPRTERISTAVLQPNVRTGVGWASGLQPTEQSFRVTKADGHYIHELDGRPAEDVYRELFGDAIEHGQFLISKPLGVHVGEDEMYVVVPGSTEDGSLKVTSQVPAGTEVRILDPSKDAVLDGTKAAIDTALTNAGDPDDIAAVLVFNCNCRWYFLSDSESRNRETEIIKDAVGDDVPIAGLYSYGEIGGPGVQNGARNQHIVALVISNEPVPTNGGNRFQ